MNEEKLKAYEALANGDWLMDPKYAPHPKQAEERLKIRVKENWQHRKDFPSWVSDYCKKWEAQANDVRRTERPAAEGDNRTAVPENAAR